MTTTLDLTTASLALFVALAHDANEWGGTPCWGANVGGSKADNANLTDLKRKGLLYTDEDEGCEWVHFTSDGKAFAASMGVAI